MKQNVILDNKLKNIAGYPEVSGYKRKKTPIRNTVIIGDSMVRNINGKHLANRLANQRVYVKSYGGMKIGDTKYHAIPNLQYNPHHVIIHVGTNEIRTKKSAKKIANDIIDVCTEIKSNQNDVSVSSLVLRGNEEESEKVKEVNYILKQLCIEHNFFFFFFFFFY